MSHRGGTKDEGQHSGGMYHASTGFRLRIRRMLIASIYVKLEDEGVDVLRPVLAEQVSGRVFIIDPRAKVPTDEQWAFRPGQRVYCEWRTRFA
jgi:hypothetical protein